MLRERLSSRRSLLPSVMLAALTSGKATMKTVPPHLVESTLQAALDALPADPTPADSMPAEQKPAEPPPAPLAPPTLPAASWWTRLTSSRWGLAAMVVVGTLLGSLAWMAIDGSLGSMLSGQWGVTTSAGPASAPASCH